MPLVSVYIRVGDIEAWKALPNKSKAIHDLLQAQRAGTFDRSEYLTNQRAERAANRGLPVITEHPPAPAMKAPKPEPAPIAYNGPDKPELVVPIKPQPAPPSLTANLPPEIRGAFVKADSIPTPPPKPTTPGEEQACCKEPAPCRHWVWDINNGDGYVNSISGRKKVAE